MLYFKIIKFFLYIWFLHDFCKVLIAFALSQIIIIPNQSQSTKWATQIFCPIHKAIWNLSKIWLKRPQFNKTIWTKVRVSILRWKNKPKFNSIKILCTITLNNINAKANKQRSPNRSKKKIKTSLKIVLSNKLSKKSNKWRKMPNLSQVFMNGSISCNTPSFSYPSSIFYLQISATSTRPFKNLTNNIWREQIQLVLLLKT